jgi:phosphotransferase system HPr-like phosphotransfer protein
MRLLRTTALAAFGAATAVLLAAAPAVAAAPDDLPTLRAAVTARIDLRLAALTKDTTTITAAKHLTDGDKATLTSLISADTTAMNSLKTKVAGETTAAGVKADATSMVDDYRIFILVGPKVRLTIAGDAEQAAITKLQTVHDKLADLVAKAKAAGKDTTAAEQNLADMAAAITKAQDSLSGQVAAVLAIQPGPDGTAIRAKVAAVRAGIGTTRASLKTAVADAKKVTAFLKSAK